MTEVQKHRTSTPSSVAGLPASIRTSRRPVAIGPKGDDPVWLVPARLAGLTTAKQRWPLYEQVVSVRAGKTVGDQSGQFDQRLLRLPVQLVQADFRARF